MGVNACAIVVEGVLQQPISSAPIIAGINLYKGLSHNFHIILISDQDGDDLTYWLRLEGLKDHGKVISKDGSLDGRTPEARRLYQCNSLRASGYSIEFVVEPNPEIAAELFRNGFTVLNYLHFSYALPQWRPDFEEETKSWEDLQRAAIQDRIMRETDARLDFTPEERVWE